MQNKFFGFVYAMNYIAQAAWSFVFPAGIWIGTGLFLRRRLQWGDWVVAVAIVLGVLSGFLGMFRYIVRMADYSTGEFNKQKKDRNK